jgi:hypothetical protein
MNTLSYEQTHTDMVMGILPEALEWLEKKVPQAKVSRFSRYKRYIDEFYSAQSDIEGLEEKFSELNWAFQEICELVHIYQSFKNEDNKAFNGRIEKIVNGQDLVPGSFESKYDGSRDFQYELLVGTFFRELGYNIDFNDDADVIATRNNKTIYIECKRLKSETSLEKNIKKAEKQLRNRKNKEAIGMVFIDIASCVWKDVSIYEYNDILCLYMAVKQKTNDFISKNAKEIDRLLDDNLESSIAICFSFFRCLWLSNLQINYLRDYSVRTSAKISDEQYKMLKMLLR